MRKQIFFLLIILLAFSCKPKENFVYMSNHNFEKEVTQAKYSGLIIHEADVLEIKVSAFDDLAVKPFNIATMEATSDPDLNQQNGSSRYMVTTEGFVIMPVLGKIYCKGMTKQQLKEDIEERLKVYLTDPMVDIRLVNFSLSVIGEVKSPGQITSSNEKLNIFQALSLAGDMLETGDRTNVKLIRNSEKEGKDTVVSLDISEAGIVNSPYYYLQLNDRLYVEPNRNKQISANIINPNRTLFLQLLAVTMSVLVLIIRFTN